MRHWWQRHKKSSPKACPSPTVIAGSSEKLTARSDQRISLDMCISPAVMQKLIVPPKPWAKLRCVPIYFHCHGAPRNWSVKPLLWTPEPGVWCEASQQALCEEEKKNFWGKISAQKRCCRGWGCGHLSPRMTPDLGSMWHQLLHALSLFCYMVVG